MNIGDLSTVLTTRKFVGVDVAWAPPQGAESANLWSIFQNRKKEASVSPCTAVPLNNPPNLNCTTLTIKFPPKSCGSSTTCLLWAAQVMKHPEITPLLHIWRWSWSGANQFPVCPQAPLEGWKVCIIPLADVFTHKSWGNWGDSHIYQQSLSAVPHSVLTPYSTHHPPKNIPAMEMALSSQQHDLVTAGNGRARLEAVVTL